MARRRSNENTIDFSGYYNEPEVDPISMAMQLLGMESKSQESEAAKLMSMMQWKAEQQRAKEATEFEREKFNETKTSGAEARKLAGLQEERLGRAATEDIAYKKGQQDIARQQLIASALEKIAGVGQLGPEAQAMIEQLPGMAEPLRRGRGERELGAVTPQLQAAYANKDAAKRDAAIKLIYGQMSPYARENVNWQDLNALIAPDKSRPAGVTPPIAGPSVGSQLMSPEGVRIADIFAPKVAVDPELRTRISPEVYSGFPR